MELFSKRYAGGLRNLRFRFNPNDKGKIIIEDPLRNRLLHEIQYIIQSNEYLENFLLVDNKDNASIQLNQETLQKISFRELGYDLSTVINYQSLEITLEDDYKFFDLIELFIIFSKEEMRSVFTERLNIIFKEECKNFCIHSFMIIDKSETGLRSISHLIKNDILKNKLIEFYEINRIKPDYQSLARISADILQFLFSSPKGQKQNKLYSEKMCQEIALKSTTKDQANEFKALLNETVKNAKLLSNKIENIRHTDKSSIPVDRPNLYKLIATGNMSIAELVILSMPEKYILSKLPEEIKKEYLTRFKIDPTQRYFINSTEEEDSSDIKPEDLPF